MLEQHFPDPDDVDSFSTESVYIDSARSAILFLKTVRTLRRPPSLVTYRVYVCRRAELELELRHEVMNLRRNPRFYAQILINEFRPFYQGTALRYINSS